jgi:hypothetical protein
MRSPMIWTSMSDYAVLYLPDRVTDKEDLAMVEEAILMQLKSWRRGWEAELAARWPFPDVPRNGDSD